MNTFESELLQKPSIWLVDNELGIHYPENGGRVEYYDDKTKKWKKSPWKTDHLLLVRHVIEFVSFV